MQICVWWSIRTDPAFFADIAAADVVCYGKRIGVMGVIHPEVLENFKLKFPCGPSTTRALPVTEPVLCCILFTDTCFVFACRVVGYSYISTHSWPAGLISLIRSEHVTLHTSVGLSVGDVNSDSLV